MPNRLDFVFILHNHQPVGNNDKVLEDAWTRCYDPFLAVVERHPDLKFVLHYSGTLLEWLEEKHPEVFPRLQAVVDRGQVEVLGGGFGEPILVMLPDADRVGQLVLLSDYLEEKIRSRPRGMWMTERVWEQNLVHDIREAGLEYTVLDDSHFKRAGLGELDLYGPFLTEDRGALLALYPLDEPLRYLIPYATPEKAVDHLRQVVEGGAERVIVFGDDGEKFGVWPESYKHCYEEGWLDRFFGLVEQNRDWLHMTTLADVHARRRPRRRIYLPDASYREMMIWQLPPRESASFQTLVEGTRQGDTSVPETFLAAGSWRNFRVKYPESNDMYTRMMSVSRKVAGMNPRGAKTVEARKALYRGQCNCPYWHGVFGGLYLSHLRAATYRELLKAEWLADASRLKASELRIEEEDRNLDGDPDLVATSKKMSLCVVPNYGGHLLAWEFYDISHNILATLTRRPEAYHGRPTSDGKTWAGGTEFLYDWYKRESFIDHFFGQGADLNSLMTCKFPEEGDFVDQPFQARVEEQGQGAARLVLERQGFVWSGGERAPLRVRKFLHLQSRSADLEVRVEIENAGHKPVSIHYGNEWNFAFSLGDAPERDLFRGPGREFVSNLGTPQDLTHNTDIRLMDGWLGIILDFHFDTPADVWTFPVMTLSQSEQGFDENYQGTCFVPHWQLDLAPGESWKTGWQVAVTTKKQVLSGR